MTKVLSNCCAYLEETLNHLKCIKLKDNLGGTVAEWFATILLDADQLYYDVAFNTDHLGYITHKFENNSDPRFHLRSTHKYNEVK